MINQVSFNSLKNFFFFVVLAVVTLAFGRIVWPFIYPLFLAAIVTILFRPLYLWLVKRFRCHEKLAATTTLITVFLIILLPLSALISVVTQQTIDISTNVSKQVSNYVGDGQEIITQIKHLPIFESLQINEEQIREKFLELTGVINEIIFSNVKKIIENSFSLGISIFIMFYALYYFLLDGEKIIRKLIRLSPLDDEYEKKFIVNFVATTKVVLKSTLFVGCIQGLLLGSVLFWLCGIPAPLFWGVLMTIFAIIPVLGTGIIWLPVAAYQLLTGNIVVGISILIGGLILSNVDNLIKPILIQKEIKIHPLIILLSTFGGLTIFGLLGFIIGPIIASLVLELWNIYEYKYKRQLNNN
jgi:predicted PurR-regulated permease PerM